MIVYPPINYLNDLTIDQINLATPLTFAQYISPINAFGDMLNWDFRAFFSTSVNNTGARNMFAFQGTANATYDLFSQSFFDPFVLQLFDEQGRRCQRCCWH